MKDKSGSVGLYSDQQGSSRHDWLLAHPDINQMMPFKPSAAKGEWYTERELQEGVTCVIN